MRFLFAIVLLPLSALGAAVVPIQHNPWTTTTNDPSVTVAATQPVSITTPSSMGLEINGLISTTYEVNTPINVRSFAPTNWIWGVDDTDVFQDALTSLSGSSVLAVPPGTYQVRELAVPSGGHPSIALSQGTTIKQLPTATNSVLTVTGTNTGSLNIVGPGIFDQNWQNMPASQMTNQVNYSSIIAITNANTSLKCENVTFTNSVRAAIRFGGAGLDLIGCQILNIKTNSCDGNGTIGYTYGAFCQPTGYNQKLYVNVRDTVLTSCVGTDTNAVYLSGSGIWISEQANALVATDNTNRYVVNIDGCQAYGIGGWYGVAEGGAFEVYNGSASCRVVNCFVDTYAQAGIKVQRTPSAQIIGNRIRNGYNAFNGLGGIYYGASSAIIYEPDAREGNSPFIGPRLGEKHYRAVISDNMVENFQRNGIYCTGADVLIHHNLYWGRNPGGVNPVAIALFNGDVTVDHERFIDIPDYLIAATGAYTNIVVQNCDATYRSVTNSNGLFLFQNVTDLHLLSNRGNLMTNNAGAFIYVDACTNVFAYDNYVRLNSTNAIAFNVPDSNTVSQITERNNSWRVSQWYKSTNSVWSWEVGNEHPGNLALAGLRVRSVDSGGGIYAANTNYANANLAGRMFLTPDTSATGFTFDLYTGQDLQLRINNTMRHYVAGSESFFGGSLQHMMHLETDDPDAIYQDFRHDSTNLFSLGWVRSAGGVVFTDGNLNQNLVVKDDTGDTEVRGKLDAKGITSTVDGIGLTMAPAVGGNRSTITFKDSLVGSARSSIGHIADGDTNLTLNVNAGNLYLTVPGGYRIQIPDGIPVYFGTNILQNVGTNLTFNGGTVNVTY